MNRSPKPVFANPSVCRNMPFVVNPTNGSHFRLYNALPLGKPIAEGQLFQLNAGSQDTTYYLTNADSLFESLPVAISVRPFRADVAILQTEINLDSAQMLSLVDQTRDVVWRRWDMGDGTLIRDSSAVNHVYKKAGEYTVRLTVLNAKGCEDTFSQTVAVSSHATPTMPVIPQETTRIRIYPNPTEGIVHIRVPESKSLTQVQLFTPLGREVAVVALPAGEPNVYTVDLAGQGAGLYQLQLAIGETVVRKNILLK